MTSNIDEKLAEIQEFLAHQDRQIQDLNEVVTAQAKEIDTLKKYIKIKFDKIENNLQGINEENHKSVSEEAAANKPPHY